MAELKLRVSVLTSLQILLGNGPERRVAEPAGAKPIEQRREA